MSEQKCWMVGHWDLGYLLYWTDTRARARMLGASDMVDSPLPTFEDAMTLRALRVPDLDNLHGDDNDRRMFLIAGCWTECSGCHNRVDLDTQSFKPYLESLGSPHVWCEVCARDIDGAFEASRDDLLRSVKMTNGREVPA